MITKLVVTIIVLAAYGVVAICGLRSIMRGITFRDMLDELGFKRDNNKEL